MSGNSNGKASVELDQVLVALINAQDDARKALKMNVDFLTARVQNLANENDQLRKQITEMRAPTVVEVPTTTVPQDNMSAVASMTE